MDGMNDGMVTEAGQEWGAVESITDGHVFFLAPTFL
jgi:hypothetical protein